jgi:hypothetical protein
VSKIEDTARLWDIYVKGWDAALRQAAFMFEGSERAAILALLKTQEKPFPAPSGSTFL